MQKLIVLALVGLAAQLVDGSLGMGYGVTSTSLLLAFGIAPAVASASVHLAEVFTTAASGVSHMKFGNVDKGIIWKLVVPGAVGAFLGATVLSHLPASTLKPYISIFLIALGLYILIRFLINARGALKIKKRPGLTYFLSRSALSQDFLMQRGAAAGALSPHRLCCPEMTSNRGK